MKNRLIDREKYKQLLLKESKHKLFKSKVASKGKTLIKVVDELISDYLAVVDESINLITPTIAYFQNKEQNKKGQIKIKDT